MLVFRLAIAYLVFANDLAGMYRLDEYNGTCEGSAWVDNTVSCGGTRLGAAFAT